MSKGFTLIEVSVVIVILSIILVPLYRYIYHQKESDQQRAEDVLEERVLSSLSLFFKNNGRYPCPADPTLRIGDTNFGSENCAGAGGAGVVAGDLPIRELGIPPKAAANVYGWKHTYAVTAGLTTLPPTAAGAITVNDDSGNPLVNNAPFVVINHGRNGAGAATLSGGTGVACPAGAARESENCDGDAVFQEFQRSTDSGTQYYDDTVMFSLVRGENSQWIPSGLTAGRLNVVNRNAGNVGIGADPGDRLHIVGGDVRVEPDTGGVGGNVAVGIDVVAGGTVRANSDVTAGNRVQSPVFFYGTP